MTATDLFQTFLKDALVADKYGIKPAKAETMKLSDETSVLFVKVLKECVREYEQKNARASTNLKNYVEGNITEGDMPNYSKQNLDTETD